MSNPLRPKVINLYKNLLYMGREYPQGYDYFRTRCKRAFLRNKDATNPQQIQMFIQHGEFVIKELKALYYLKKYRTLKRRYYADQEDMEKFPVLKDYVDKTKD